MGITVRGSRGGAAAARAWKSKQGTTIGSRDRSGARGSGSGAGGIITPADYSTKHASGFGTTQFPSIKEGMKNIFGGQNAVIRDGKTGAIVVIDSDINEATLIEPPGGLNEAQRKEIIAAVDKQGDVPNISETVAGGIEQETAAPGSDFWGGDSFFGGDSHEQTYVEGDASSTTGASSGGKLSMGIVMIGALVLGVLYLFFGGGRK